ncbi:MAG: hypothetical protein AVDCRST_MAG86-1293 [uncultured Truepera sp.]|uniref:Uncharacterized protein n=1 Tax=uncultured Truepera sp. TaxID=543023 RepID=A0A6J4V4K2_9DEIN|nr:MAG: hypothetical protein AVDCRST_MAG86-1293 [uncultured Truepera sp.]
MHAEYDKPFIDAHLQAVKTVDELARVLGPDVPIVVDGYASLQKLYDEYDAKVEDMRSRIAWYSTNKKELETTVTDLRTQLKTQAAPPAPQPDPVPTPVPTPDPGPTPTPTPPPSLEPKSTSKVEDRPSLFSGDRPGAPNLEKLPGALQARFDELKAFHENPKRSPNLTQPKLKTHPDIFLDDGKKTPRPIMGLMGMFRGSQKAFHDLAIGNRVFRNDYAVITVAEWALMICASTIDRTYKNPATGQYAKSYFDFLKRAQGRYPKMSESQIDMAGVKRFPYLNELPEYDWHDGHALDFGLAFGTMVEALRFLRDNLPLDGIVVEAHKQLEDLIFNHILPRMTFIAKVRYGENARPYMWCQNLRHAYLSVASGWERMYEITGDPKLSSEVEMLWQWWREDWKTVPLPDGRTGIGGPHGIRAAAKAKGNEFYAGWHNSVYLEETMFRLAVDAVVFGGAGPTVKDLEQATNLLYHTLPRYGWTHRSRVAGDMGGGGKLAPLDQRKIAMFTDGSQVPAHAYVGHDSPEQAGVPDFDWSGSFRRGGVLVGAPWTDIPNFEARVKEVHAMSVQEAKEGDKYMGCLLLPLALFEAKRAGMLPRAA